MADESHAARDESEPRGRSSAIPESTPMSDDSPLLSLPPDEAHLWLLDPSSWDLPSRS